MDTLIIAAIVVVALLVLSGYFVMKYAANRSGGNDDVWKPGERKDPNTEG